MKLLKFLALVILIMLVGGIVLQALGYVDSPLFSWFTNVELYR